METEEDLECPVKATERQELLDEIADEVGLKHPITFDVFDLCEYYHHPHRQRNNHDVAM